MQAKGELLTPTHKHMYSWRKLNAKQRNELLQYRKFNRLPWHSPFHRTMEGRRRYMFTASCYEHASHLIFSIDRLRQFETEMVNVAHEFCDRLVGWVVLPNHYHFLAVTSDALKVLKKLGKLHGRTSHRWNGEEGIQRRKVWCCAVETVMKSERHYWATLNYIHHNPVKHGYVSSWQEWPWSSAGQYLEKVGRQAAETIWRNYPINDYGKDWDNF